MEVARFSETLTATINPHRVTYPVWFGLFVHPLTHICNIGHVLILVINQLDAQIFFFIISLLYASTCFEHYVLIIRRSKLYYTASGVVTLCRWPSGAQVERGLSQPVHRTAIYMSDDTRCCIIQF